jgi:hypothetical protein
VHETESDLRKLQSLLDESYDAAGAHLRSVFTPERRMSAEDVCAAMRGVCILSLATVTRGGAPIVAPVDGLFFRGRFHFGSGESALRFRHLRARPQVSAACVRGEELCVIVHGTAHEIDKRTPDAEAFRAYNTEVYGADWEGSDYWKLAPYAYVAPRRMFAARFAPAPGAGGPP